MALLLPGFRAYVRLVLARASAELTVTRLFALAIASAKFSGLNCASLMSPPSDAVICEKASGRRHLRAGESDDRRGEKDGVDVHGGRDGDLYTPPGALSSERFFVQVKIMEAVCLGE